MPYEGKQGSSHPSSLIQDPAKDIEEFDFEEDAILPDLKDYVYFKKIVNAETYSKNQRLGWSSLKLLLIWKLR
jgi:hypothetical protein